MTQGRVHRCVSCPDVIAQYQSGKTAAEVGASCGRDPQWVYEILRRHGIRLRDARKRSRTSNAEIKAFYVAGANASRVAQRVGISRERVRQILVREGIAHPDRRTGRHTCTEACQVVQAASPPIIVLNLAKQTGVTSSRLKYAMGVHRVSSGRKLRRHVCDVRCETFRQALADGVSQADAARKVGWPISHGSGRLRVYHPDWPWPDAYQRPAPKMRSARALVQRLLACHHNACGDPLCQAVVDAQRFLA